MIKLSRIAAALYDRTLCSAASVQRQQPASKNPAPGRKLSVAIPHYERGHLIHRPLRNVLADPRIEEITIVDDGSSAENYALLRANIGKLDRSGKVRIHRRTENRGALFTKMECAEKTTGDWLILLDSDNTVFRSYLEAVFREPDWKPATIYCPVYAFPYYRFDPLVGLDLDFSTCAELCRTGTLRKVYIINDGNYLFHRATYLEKLEPLRPLARDVADVMVANYLWLSRGGRLKVLPGAVYYHRIDASSFWMRTKEESRRRVMYLFDRFENNQPWDDEVLRALQASA